ncbi:MAG: hypothetical protein RR146_07890 [Lachnospiraceae bacterium]
MTDSLFFDSDCISAFLWVKEQNLLALLYPGRIIIPKPASIAMAKTIGGIVASNNLKDISSYIIEYGLKHITTGDILIEALEKGLITENEGNTIWTSMLAKRRKLGASSFSEYIKSKQ